MSATEAAERIVSVVSQIIDRALADGILLGDIVLVPAHRVGGSSGFAIGAVQGKLPDRFAGIQFYNGEPAGAPDLLSLRRKACVIFVDDFIGSGKQFKGSFSAWASALSGRDVTFILATAIACTEGVKAIEERGARVQPSLEHAGHERFWAVCRAKLDDAAMKRLIVLACELHGVQPFGQFNGGCMIVLGRNCPNNVAMLLRGTRGQRIWRGLFPRYDDLHPANYEAVVGKVKLPPGCASLS